MEVRTQEEFDRAYRFLREIGDIIWLGGSDREVEGEWRWESSAERIDMNKFWESGQPNEIGDQNCLYMLSVRFGDFKCSFRLPFVCEFD